MTNPEIPDERLGDVQDRLANRGMELVGGEPLPHESDCLCSYCYYRRNPRMST